MDERLLENWGEIDTKATSAMLCNDAKQRMSNKLQMHTREKTIHKYATSKYLDYNKAYSYFCNENPAHM